MHILRVCSYSELLAQRLGLPGEIVTRIRRYASLHDVGKVGLPDDILKKPGELTQAEFDAMKRHTIMGFELLTLARSDLIAKNIALCHHEKYNGRGYPYGLAGRAIPLEARIVALADVFDALTTKRCYKNAYSMDRARAIVAEERGEQFDPVLVDLFLEAWDDVVAIPEQYLDMAPSTISVLGAVELPPKPRSVLEQFD